MKPDPKKQIDKKITTVMKKLKKLNRQIQNPPSIRLENPIQRGWIRHYILTAEAKARPDAKTLEEMLLIIDHKQRSWRRDFLRKISQGRKPIEINQPLLDILVDYWKRNPFLENWRSYFHLEYKIGCHCTFYYNTKKPQWYYVFTNTSWVELKVEPNWLTHLKLLDPLLIEEAAELEAWIRWHSGHERYNWLKGKSTNFWKKSPLRKKQERQAKQDLRNYLASPEEAEMRLHVRQFRFSFFILISPT